MKLRTDVRIAMAILVTIVFVCPSRSYLLTTMKVFLFHHVIGTLILIFLLMMTRRWIMPANIFSSFTYV